MHVPSHTNLFWPITLGETRAINYLPTLQYLQL